MAGPVYFRGSSTAQFLTSIIRYPDGTTDSRGIGAPEGVVTATVGSTYMNTSNGLFYTKTSGTGNTGWSLTPTTGSSPGDIVAFAGSSIPANSLACDGSAVSRTTYAALFAAIGTTWGAGDGSTTFNIPDLRGAHLRGDGTSTVFTQNGTFTLAGTISDQFQGHQFGKAAGVAIRSSNINSGASGLVEFITADSALANAINIIGDGTNGTPRTGTETRPNARVVKYRIIF